MKSLCSRELVPERHCSTTHHDRASQFPHGEVRTTHPFARCNPVSLNRACTSPCKLQESLIMPNTNLNECLHRPSSALCFQAKTVALQQDQRVSFTLVMMTFLFLSRWPHWNHGKMMGTQIPLPNRFHVVYVLTTQISKIWKSLKVVRPGVKKNGGRFTLIDIYKPVCSVLTLN